MSIRRKGIISLLVAFSITSLTSIGASASEWKQSNNGNWWYDKGSSFSIGWEKINGAWYYFDTNGIMQTGWIKDGDNWYYLYSDGKMALNTTIDGYNLSNTGAWSSVTQPSNSGGSHADYFKKADTGVSSTSSDGTLSENLQRSGN